MRWPLWSPTLSPKCGERMGHGVLGSVVSHLSSGGRSKGGKPAASDLSLVRLARNGVTSAAYQEVEVGAFVGLHHVFYKERLVAALECGLGRGPFGAAACKLRIVHFEVQAAGGNVELDPVTFVDQRQRATESSLGADVEHHRSIGCAAHARVADAHHVG